MITWKILGVDIAPELNGQTNVVTDIYFSVIVSDEVTTVKHNDVVDIPFNTLATYQFIPYADLTETDLLTFVKNQFGAVTDSLEQAILSKFSIYKNQGKTYIPFTG
jgi:hypothetical protein